MKAKTIEELRVQVEHLVRDALLRPYDGGLDGNDARARSGRLPRERSVSVVVSPLNTLSITAVSPLFHGLSFDERSDWLWDVLEASLLPEEQERVDFWLLLSPREAKSVRPSKVGPQRRAATIPVATPRA